MLTYHISQLDQTKQLTWDNLSATCDEVICLVGSAGRGKTTRLLELAIDHSSQGKDVLVFTLESSEEQMLQRLQSLQPSQPMPGKIKIKQLMIGTGLGTIQDYLEAAELKGELPNSVIIDYYNVMDLSNPADLDDLCTEFNIFVATAINQSRHHLT